MKKVYVAHPLRGNVAANIAKTTELCRKLVADHRGILPLSPLHNFGFLDPETYDQVHGMDLCYSLLSCADELWVHGDWQGSEGCKMEISYARDMDIPVVFK